MKDFVELKLKLFSIEVEVCRNQQQVLAVLPQFRYEFVLKLSLLKFDVIVTSLGVVWSIDS